MLLIIRLLKKVIKKNIPLWKFKIPIYNVEDYETGKMILEIKYKY